MEQQKLWYNLGYFNSKQKARDIIDFVSNAWTYTNRVYLYDINDINIMNEVAYEVVVERRDGKYLNLQEMGTFDGILMCYRVKENEQRNR